MEKDLLDKVIETEKQIQEVLEAEKNKIRLWIECVREESGKRLVEETAELEVLVHEKKEAIKKDAEAKSFALIEAAGHRTARIESLPDVTLRRIIMNHLHRILPG